MALREAAPALGPEVTDAGPSTRSSVARIGAATAVSAICGYAVLYLAARELGPALFSVFGVFWGAFGLVTGAANGLLQETTREVRLSLAQRDRSPLATTLPVRIASAFAIASAVLIVGTAPLWASHVFTEFRWLSVALLAGGLAGFCMHATTLGALAGSSRWTQYGVLMVTDAGIRLVVAIVTFAATLGLVGYLWATVSGSMSWLLLTLVSKPTRDALKVPALVDTMEFLRGARHSIAAAAASAVLVMGFPVLLQSTAGDLGTTGGVVILAVTLTRAPLLVPLTALQGNLIAHFVDEQDRRLRALATPAAIILGVGAAGIALAASIGPGCCERCSIPHTRQAAHSWLADRRCGHDRAVDTHRSGHRGTRPPPCVLRGMGWRDCGFRAAVTAAAGTGRTHGDRIARRTRRRDSGAPDRARVLAGSTARRRHL